MKEKLKKIISLQLAIVYFFQATFQGLYISSAYANNSSTQPEFTSFNPVNSTELVNKFTGDFNYQLPLFEMGGVPVTLHYSNTSPDQDASWVGDGWNLSANGSINRQKRGFADDVEGSITQYSKIGNFWSAGLDVSGQASIDYSTGGSTTDDASDDFSSSSLSIGGTLPFLQYSNKKGFTFLGVPEASASCLGFTTGYQLEEGDLHFYSTFSPVSLLSDALQNVNFGLKSISDNNCALPKKMLGTLSGAGIQNFGYAKSFHANYSLYKNERNTQISSYTGFNLGLSISVSASFGDGEGLGVSATSGMSGNINYQSIDESKDINYAGLLRMAKYDFTDEIMADCGTEKYRPFDYKDKKLPIPYNNPDQFIVSGPNVSGTFRAYQTEVQHFSPYKTTNYTYGCNVDLNVSADNIVDISGSVGITTGDVQDELKENIKEMFKDPETYWDYLTMQYVDIAKDLLVETYWEAGSDGFMMNKNELTRWNYENEDELTNFGDYYFRFEGDVSGYSTGDDNAVDISPDDESMSGVEESAEYLDDLTDAAENNSNIDVKQSAANTFAGQSSWSTINFTKPQLANYNRTQSSTIIAYTNAELNAVDADGKQYKGVPNSGDELIDRSSADIQEHIGEFIINDKSGTKHVYGLPVYTWNEKQLAYEYNGDEDPIVHASIDGEGQDKVGELNNEPYATAYLETAIFDPMYIDRTGNGASADDYGNYLLYNYDRITGNNDKTLKTEGYHYRMPYTGGYLDKGDMVNPEDNKMQFISGDKELYYLSTITTKYGEAIFYTSDRQDGIAAADDATASSSSTAKGDVKLKKLDSIYVYSYDLQYVNSTSTSRDADANKKLIKRIYFKYDYSSWPNYQSNSTDAVIEDGVDINANKGKLTLKKVWVENESSYDYKIYPYEFVYSYPSSTVVSTADNYVDYPTEYNSLENQGNGLNENPDFSACNIDAWGYYRNAGNERDKEMQTWLDQTPTSDFDPAAWQLKMIKLPTGAQIHVLYEQDQYLYVQDQRAMVMTPISSITDASTSDNSPAKSGNKFTANLFEIGITSSDDINALNQLAKDLFVDDNERIYSKIYYQFSPSAADAETGYPNRCGWKYFEGYYHVPGISDGTSDFHCYIGGGSDDNFDSPWSICHESYEVQGHGLLDSEDGECKVKSYGDVSSDNFIEDAAGLIYDMYSSASNLISSADEGTCKSVEPSNSYLRLPVVNKKLGGGLRVKYILTYDPGIESGDQSLLGSHYQYIDAEGKCSGVATTEPEKMREENALIRYDKNAERSTTNEEDAVAAGTSEYDQAVLPSGESLLPAPSVGYSAIRTSSISEQSTNTGVMVDEFYTCKDFPFSNYSSNTEIESSTDAVSEPLADWAFLYSKSIERRQDFMAQGYSFIINSMHGNVKAETVYASNDASSLDATSISAQTNYEYTEPGEELNIITNYWNNATFSSLYDEEITNVYDLNESFVEGGKFEITQAALGRSEDYITESMCQSDSTITNTWNLSGGVFWGIPYVFITYQVSENISNLFTNVTNKVIYYPPILKKVSKYQDGINTTTENLYFDANGTPVVTKNYDGYNGYTLAGLQHNGEYISYQMPAAINDYPQLGSQSENTAYNLSTDDATVIHKYYYNGSYYLYFEGLESCDQLHFYPGDFISVTSYTDAGTIDRKEFYNVGEWSGKFLEIIPTSNNYYYEYDTDASVVGKQNVDVEIIVSGKANMTSAMKGSVVTYGGEPEVYFDTLSKKYPDEWNERVRYADALNEAINEIEENDLATFVSTFNSSLNLFRNEAGDSCGNTIIWYINKVAIDLGYEKCATEGSCENLSATLYQYQFTRDESDANYCFKIDPDGLFYIDPTDGSLKYANLCNSIDINCVTFCNQISASTLLDKVITSSATTFSDNWNLDSQESLKDYYQSGSTYNDYENNFKGNFFPLASYGYKTERENIFTTGLYSYSTGMYKSYDELNGKNFELFNWKYDINDADKWIKANETILRSPLTGQGLVDTNALGISSVKKEYTNGLPYLVAQNADYNTVFAHSFENHVCNGGSASYSSCLEDGLGVMDKTYEGLSSSLGGDVVSTTAHTGRYSFKPDIYSITSTVSGVSKYISKGYFSLNTLTFNKQIQDNGLIVKFWVNETSNSADLTASLYEETGLFSSVNFSKIATVGEWSLYEAKISSWGSSLSSGSSFSPIIKLYTSGSSVSSFYIDDIRVAPSDAAMNTYVYDAVNARMVAQFDDQNFAQIFQYNQDGKLIRKLKETDRGLKTLVETQYNIKGEDR